MPLAQAYDVGEIVNLVTVGVWLTNQNGSQASYPKYLVGSLVGETNSTDPRVNLAFFLETAIRYIKLHQELFGVYKGDLMPKPTSDTLHRVRGTFQVQEIRVHKKTSFQQKLRHNYRFFFGKIGYLKSSVF